jgi:hypothetical protein
MSASCGTVAVLTLGSNPAYRPSDRKNVISVVPRAVHLTESTLRAAIVSSAPAIGKKMTMDVR